MPNEALMTGAGALCLAMIVMLTATLLTMEQHATAIVQRLGKLVRVADPDLRAKFSLIDRAIDPRLRPHGERGSG